MSLKSKIWLTIVAIVLMFSFFTLYYFPNQQSKLMLRNYNNEVQNLANTVSLGVKIAITEQNFQGVQTAMEFVKDDPRLQFISLLQTDTAWNDNHTSYKINETVFQTVPDIKNFKLPKNFDQSVIVKRSPFKTRAMSGAILLAFSTKAILESKQQIRTTSLVVSAIVFLIGIAMGFWLSKSISDPVLALRNAATRVGEGDFTQRVEIKSGDEIADLGKSFNAMVSYLQKTTKKLNETNHSLASANTTLQQTLEELKNTQTQLIHSEKMASLGELTAGIAHEIQNPLNFVNNFSEVSGELADELKEAVAKNDAEDAMALAGDIKENLNKIAFHGKRADSIVKGMLQHSRASGGKKEPTDINALADEYLRLSYHGLRAKDKTFNATFKTDFDAAIGKVDVAPQDVGRVLLNLFNNAFYSVNEKRKTCNSNYQPLVSVTTKLIQTTAGARELEIRVRDNGNGIPEKVLDKIFQPFFTTKPTGLGTGLGLSLSYDIITKGHDGTIDAITGKGEFAEFIIKLPVK